MKERLQKVLANRGVCARRKAEALIEAGRVEVNGKTVTTLGTKVDPETDELKVDGTPVYPRERQLFLFHKPRGVVTTLCDPQGRKCIGDLLQGFQERLYPVGRLDIDVSGLLLLTNDGDFAQQMLHPRFEQKRVYWALVEETPQRKEWQRLTGGIELQDGFGRAEKACSIENTGALGRSLFGAALQKGSVLELHVVEGRKHFVKRLVQAAGIKLILLSRIAFGPYSLNNIDEGRFKRVSRINLS